VAYLSRSFGPVGDDEQRRQASAVPLADGSANPTPGAPAASGTAPASPNAGPIDHNAVRSFFDANKDQGAKVLGGLESSLNQRIGSAQGGLTPITPTTPFAPMVPPSLGANPDPVASAQQGIIWGGANAVAKEAHDKANAEIIDKNKPIAAQNVASLAPLGQDVKQLGSMEGQQNLLAQGGNPEYSPGQNRLDAWLSGAAGTRDPSPINNVSAGFNALNYNAGITDPATQKQKTLEDYLNGR
jgi:hypothetical protein